MYDYRLAMRYANKPPSPLQFVRQQQLSKLPLSRPGSLLWLLLCHLRRMLRSSLAASRQFLQQQRILLLLKQALPAAGHINRSLQVALERARKSRLANGCTRAGNFPLEHKTTATQVHESFPLAHSIENVLQMQLESEQNRGERQSTRQLRRHQSHARLLLLFLLLSTS